MRTWVKVTIGGAALVILGISALAGTGAYFFLRHLETRSATEVEVKKEIESIRTRFAGRPPMLEIVDAKAGDIRIQRTPHPQGLRAQTLHVMTWTGAEEQVMRSDVPLWLMRFSSLNVLSHLGVAPERYRLTVEDVARFGPGIIVDYRDPGNQQILIWVE
ncbi:MAG: hypothetical protein ACM4AI_05265 [Acidobacteriota bacterium]